MKEISKAEVKYLLSNGRTYGKDIHRTIHNRHYYVTESWRNLNLLKRYREETTRNAHDEG